MEDRPTEINIITLNCWGLKHLSKLRKERLTEIGRKLAAAEPTPHIVGLQECWTQEDYQSIRRETRSVLPYGKFYYSGAFGGGLVILSKWPFEESTMFRYPLNGRPTAFFRGDWFVGKGVACAKIRYGSGRNDIIEVFNTHTHAPYEKEPHDSYICHRTAQAWEMAKLLRGAAERGHLVIGLGDFNMVPGSLPHRIITSHAPVRDVWRVLHPESSLGPADGTAEKARGRPVPTAEFNLRENGATSDSVYNTWRWTADQQKLLGPGKTAPAIPPDTADPKGKRLDYIFAGAGDGESLVGGGWWVVKRAAVGMVGPHPDLGCSLSDHFSVEATLAFFPAKPASGSPFGLSDSPARSPGPGRSPNPDEKGPPPPPPPPPSESIDECYSAALLNGTYLQSPRPSEQPSSDLDFDWPVPPAAGGAARTQPRFAYDEILATIHKYVARQRKQRRWRGIHFFAWVGAAIGCLVAVWFSPWNWLSFLLMLISSLGLAGGTIDGLIALLFVGSELRALREFEWEVANAKGIASGKPLGRDPV